MKHDFIPLRMLRKKYDKSSLKNQVWHHVKEGVSVALPQGNALLGEERRQQREQEAVSVALS